MKMKCWSVWDTSRGLKPLKMAEKCDFARICFFPEKKHAPAEKALLEGWGVARRDVFSLEKHTPPAETLSQLHCYESKAGK